MKKYLKTNRFYLDSCSAYIQFMNAGLMTDVHKPGTLIYGHYNAGTTSTNLKDKYGSMDCWRSKEGVANIFSIPVLKRVGFCIT